MLWYRFLKMERCIFFILFVAGGTFIQAQSDDKRNYYTELTVNNFRDDRSFNQPVDFENPDYSRLNAAVFFATNEQRLKNKLKVLTWSPNLEEMAAMHSEDMKEQGFFNHINPKNRKKKTPEDRARLTGISNPFIAENIATTFGLNYEQNKKVVVKGPGKFSYPGSNDLILPRTYLEVADALVKAWMQSPAHRINILSANAVQLGCGTSMYLDNDFNRMPTFMATQDFQEYEYIKIH